MYVNDHRWQRINQAFHAAMDAAPEQRNMLLSQLCGDDPALLQEVGSLISAHSDAGADFLQEPLSEIWQQWPYAETQTPLEGYEFGPYRILRKLGQGGMAEVYLAERCDNQFQKQVAIKIIRRGLDSTCNLRHFYTERQILAGLDHPYISRLLDAGTSNGIPYLVMEYVDGERIDAYCDRNRLSVPERLQLFLKVCSAVQYAHQRNVIHRDLKPGNILITSEGNPKLLDFGVAKLLGQKLFAPSSGATTTGLWLMTPEYASPEQVCGRPISVSTDIYSLGVLLYELLSGHHPYRNRDRLPHEILQAICEAEPVKPSVMAGTMEVDSPSENAAGGNSAALVTLRRVQPQRLRSQLAGDLDNVILMAMRRDLQRRYDSVEKFVQDINHCLEKRPVTATGDTLIYRAHRFLQRNRIPLAAAVLLFVLLLASGLTMRWRVDREKQRLRTDLLSRLSTILEAHDEESGLVLNASNVFFDPGRVALNSEVRERLARIAGIILAYPNLKVRIEGHTDNHGEDAYNLAISQERAEAVQAFLVLQGLPSKMITARGFGGTHPVAGNDSDEGRRQNRRVVIVLSGDSIGERIPPSANVTPLNNLPLVQSTLAAESHIAPNLALNRNAIGSISCNVNEGPAKAFNGSAAAGSSDKWCSHALPAFLQVDLGQPRLVTRFVIRHAGAGGEQSVLNTRDFNVQLSSNGQDFTTAVKVVANTRSVTMHTIPATVARFVRLNITKSAQYGDNSSRIYELEVYCDPSTISNASSCREE